MQHEKKHIQTEDGSWTLRIEKLKETYHSRHGAVTESNFVYINEGFNYWSNQHPSYTCRVLELGYGTGLTAYLSYLEAEKQQKRIDFTSLEAYPLSKDELSLLQYHQFFEGLETVVSYDEFSNLDWERFQAVSPYFNLLKNRIYFEDFKTKNSFDLIYYDAFGAHAQPELWQPQWMKKCYELLVSGGVWVSYCAKGSVRRGLEAAGFTVTRLSGPPGKREMLRAIKA